MHASFALAASPADLATLFSPEAWDMPDLPGEDDSPVDVTDEIDVVAPPALPSPEVAAERLVAAVQRRKAAEDAVAAAMAALALARAEEAPARAAARVAMVNAGVARLRVPGGMVVGVGRVVRTVEGGARVLRLTRVRVELG